MEKRSDAPRRKSKVQSDKCKISKTRKEGVHMVDVQLSSQEEGQEEYQLEDGPLIQKQNLREEFIQKEHKQDEQIKNLYQHLSHECGKIPNIEWNEPKYEKQRKARNYIFWIGIGLLLLGAILTGIGVIDSNLMVVGILIMLLAVLLLIISAFIHAAYKKNKRWRK